MKNVIIAIMFFAVCYLSGCMKNAEEMSAMTLVGQISSAWVESTDAFTNIAHKACETIREIENPTNRLKCAKAYAESLFLLDKFVRECDEQGFWGRLNVHIMSKTILHDLDLETKWIYAAKYRQLMKDELRYYDLRGSSTPMRIISRHGLNEARYKELERENEKRRKALQYRYYANQIRGCVINLYKPVFEHNLKEDCINLTEKRKKALLKKIIEITGETPKWYREELDRNVKVSDKDLK